uniref:Protein kintoun n=1 Tax=Sinocyclocheilus anshuiensis TaxID=1608454 RepID=A0A671T2A3_9TELE
MDFSKLEEINLTRDELNRFGEALKDEKFRELLNEYAAEISNPENKRRYEEEITQLEKDRGTNVQFIHPEAHHVLKTRGAGEKRFINICSDQLIDKPSSEAATGRDGKAGYNWRLPFSLTPGRPDRDAAGSRCMIYDVIFHPDALHAAEDSTRLLQLLHSTAIRGIEDAFHIELDTSNIKQLKMKYKGVPQAAVIRRPIPYRSVVDLEIIITVDLPLLRSAQDAEVSVQERRLVLESQKPAYKLDLPLSDRARRQTRLHLHSQDLGRLVLPELSVV